MANNQAPSDEEIDRFMELYDELGSIKAVAEHEDVDWSRPTVSKWIRRRQEAEEEDGEDENEQEQTSPAGNGQAQKEPEGDYTAERSGEPTRAVPEDLIEEPESPNEILLDIIERDPKLGDDEAAYIEQFFEDYGQLSPSDVTSILQDLSINNKRMTISRITRHYEKAINKRLREDRDLMYDERWATLLTKVTGDNHYIRQAQDVEPSGNGLGGIQPPRGTEGGRGPSGGGGNGITPPQPDQGGRRGGQQASHPQQPPMAGGGGSSPQPDPRGQTPQQQAPQQQSGQGGLDPFQERLLEMLEQQIGDDTQQPTTSEPSSPTEQIQELVELQQQMEQLRPEDGNADPEMAEQLGAVVDQMEQRMERLEQAIASQNDSTPSQPQQQSEELGSGSMMGEIAMLADKVDDPDLLSMLIETQTDPDVLEARAKSKEVENETEWKKAIAESLSPQATEKAADLGRVARAAFARNIEQREPVGKVSRLQPSAEQVFYFTELRDMAGQTVTHRWTYQGETRAEVAFEVGGPRWRVYSSKDFLPEWTGEWTVEVVTGDGQVIHRDTITYGPEGDTGSPAQAATGGVRGDGECGPYGV